MYRRYVTSMKYEGKFSEALTLKLSHESYLPYHFQLVIRVIWFYGIISTELLKTLLNKPQRNIQTDKQTKTNR